MNDIDVRERAGLDSLVGQVADQFIERLERGEQPDVEEYARSHPECAEVLRQVLSTLLYMRTQATAGATQPADAAQGLAGCLGDFRIIREVGRGGMGIVYEAEQLSLQRRVALKVLPFAATLDPKHLQRFQNEARAAAYLHHGNIVPVYGVGCERGVHFYAMQFIDGHTLAALIHDLRVQAHLETEQQDGCQTELYVPGVEDSVAFRSAKGRPFAERKATLIADTTGRARATLASERSHTNATYFRTVVGLGRQAALALEYAHQMGVIHRDIKPANLLVDGQGNLWVTDFGLAQVQSDTGLTMTGDLVGTLRYMSPEQALAKRVAIDQRTDIYSLGATLYELLTLECAFDGKSRQELLRQVAFDEPRPPSRLNRALPAELEIIVQKAMAKNPVERYGSAQELADDLQRYLEDKPIHAKRPTLVQRAAKWARRHRPIVWSAAVSALLLVGLTILGLSVSNAQIRQEEKQTKAALHQEQQAKAELERVLAFQRFALAERELAVNNIGRAEELLHECPENQRGLEWLLLKGLHTGPQVLRASGSPLIDVAVSPDGRHVASAGVGSGLGELILWDGVTGRKLAALTRHLGPVVSVRFSPDGKMLASFGMLDGTIFLWDVATRKVIRTWRGRGWANCSSLAFSPDGTRLAFASWDLGVRVWDVASGDEQLAYRGHKGMVICVTFSPDGRHLASSGMDNLIRVWDARTGADVRQISGQTGLVMSVVYRPDGKQIAAGGLRGVFVWEADSGQNVLTVHGMNNAALRVVFSADGKRLIAAGCMDRSVKIWDVETSRETLVLRGHNDVVWSLALSADGRRLASTSFDGTVRLWYPPPPAEQSGQTPRVLRGANGHVGALAFSPDHGRLAAGELDGTVRIWNLKTDTIVHTLKGHTQTVTSVTFSPDGKQLTSVSVEGTVMYWDAETGQLKRALPGHLGQVLTNGFKAPFAPDGGRLASVPDQQTVMVWETTGEVRWKRKSETPMLSPLALAYSADGKRLAGAGPGVIKVWDAGNGEELHGFGGPLHMVTGVAFRPDGKHLATGSWDSLVSLWDIEANRGAGLLRGHTDKVFAVAYSPDGRRLASGGADNVALVWDSQSGKKLATLRGHIGYVMSVAYSGDGKLLATASGHRYRGEICLWDTAALEPKPTDR